MSIPASQIVEVNPGVLAAAGSAVDLNGLILTQDPTVPTGQVVPFTTAQDVKDYFGPESTEGDLATIYFNGYENNTKKPGLLYFAQYLAEDTKAFIRGGSLGNMTLDDLVKLTGEITLTVSGASVSKNAISLADATSFTNAAELIETALGKDVKVSFTNVTNAFVITDAGTNQPSTITAATGDLAESLNLTLDKGVTVSQGATALAPGAFMDSITKVSLNWALFTTVWKCSLEELTEFSKWASGQNDRFGFAGWDEDTNAALPDPTGTWGAALNDNKYSGSIPTFGNQNHAVFVLAWAASLDFTRLNGRATLAFRSQSGLAASVENASDANNLITNGYNYYGDYATSKENFLFYYPGLVSGKWRWADSFVNQIWLNANLQLALLRLLMDSPSVPYNTAGYSLVEAACLDPVLQAVNFGAIRTGVILSESQKAQIANAIGQDISQSLTAKGFYIQITPAPASVRVERASPSITLYYTDGGSIQKLVVASIAIQ